MLYTKGLRLHTMTASEYRASLWLPFAASTIIEPDLRVKGPNSSQGNHRLLIQSATLHGIHTYIHTYINIHAKEVGGVQVAGASTSLQELFRLRPSLGTHTSLLCASSLNFLHLYHKSN